MKTKKSTKLIFNKINIPIVEFEIRDGAKARGIIDTGSETTIFHKDFIMAHKNCFDINISDSNIEFIGLHGSSKNRVVNLSGNLDFKCVKRYFSIHMEGAMIANLAGMKDINVEAIFGNDFLKQNDAEINYMTKKLIFN